MHKPDFEQPAILEDSLAVLSEKLLSVTKQLTESNRQLQQVQRERTDMLANLSHDLRAPVTALRGTIDYLQTEPQLTPEALSSILQLMDRRTQTLEQLICDMYDLFSLESTEKPLSLEEVDAAPFLEEYFYSSVLDNRYTDFKMELDVPSTLSCTLSIDIYKTIRVLDNLMTNAAKYSPAGSVICLAAHLNEEQKELFVSVADQGIGIPADAIPHLFNRTYTVSSSRTPNSATGSGLGLSIARAIMEKQGGRIYCTSEEKTGSTFTLVLPVISSDAQ